VRRRKVVTDGIPWQAPASQEYVYKVRLSGGIVPNDGYLLPVLQANVKWPGYFYYALHVFFLKIVAAKT
jgi:hypothetical protein